MPNKTNNKKLIKKNIHKKGVSLIIALLLTSFILSLTFSISSIIFRQIRMTTISSNSQTAFYVADSAMECASYWDRTINTSPEGINADFNTAIFGLGNIVTGSNPIRCGNNINNPYGFLKNTDTVNNIATTTFSLSYGTNKCAKVTIVKTPGISLISSRGYNTGINTQTLECDLENASIRRVVERALYLKQ